MSELVLVENENSSENESNVPEEEQKRVCFICDLPGDPIDNRIKCLSSAILKKSIEAIEVSSNQQSNTSRRAIDVTSIQLPKDLEEKGYHQKCYKQLINLSGKRKIEEIVDPDANENNPSGNNEEPEKHVSFEHGPTACVFCAQVRKRHNRQLIVCSFAEAKKNYETFRSIIDLATAKYDLSILQRIDQCQEMSVPIPYHRVCKTQYSNNSRQKKGNTDWHLRRQKHERARKNLLKFIQEEIVENMRIFQYSFLLNLFRQFLLEEYDNQKLPKCFDTSNIQSEISEHFKDAVIFIDNRGCKHVVSASATLENIVMTYANEENTINSSALFLRKIVLGVEKNPINDNVTASNLIKGECEIPYALLRFYSLLLTGGDVDKIKDPKMLVLAKSYASDVIYSIHRERVKTSKHITLGITVKSLSSSEKVLRLLHSYGHCISYSKVLELETEATY